MSLGVWDMVGSKVKSLQVRDQGTERPRPRALEEWLLFICFTSPIFWRLNDVVHTKSPVQSLLRRKHLINVTRGPQWAREPNHTNQCSPKFALTESIDEAQFSSLGARLEGCSCLWPPLLPHREKGGVRATEEGSRGKMERGSWQCLIPKTQLSPEPERPCFLCHYSVWFQESMKSW